MLDETTEEVAVRTGAGPTELAGPEVSPIETAANEAAVAGDSAERAPLNLRVLVADSIESEFSLASILRRIDTSIETIEAANGPQAERILRDREVDIGFIDRRLPGFDGREVQNWASTSKQRSMFVLVSDRLVPTWPETATLISAYEVMLKPFNESHVENLLRVFGHIHRRSTVLIVDRSRTARKIIRDMFARLPFNVLVDETDTGQHALRAVKATHFDIVLVDAEVDNGMGAEAACRVARDAPQSKIILIGGTGMKTSRSALAQFDLSGFIQKPFNGAALESALHDVMKLWRPYRLNAQLRWPPPVVPELVVPDETSEPAAA
jgi:DNA-binding NtrC family response regulator